MELPEASQALLCHAAIGALMQIHLQPPQLNPLLLPADSFIDEDAEPLQCDLEACQVFFLSLLSRLVLARLNPPPLGHKVGRPAGCARSK